MLTSGWPISTRAATYAGVTMVGLAATQLAVLHPRTGLGVAVLVVPVFVCVTLTFLIARRIVRVRADSLTDIYSRFQQGQIDEEWRHVSDPEFREARAVFLRMARELSSATRALTERDAERRRLFSDVVHEIGTPVSSLLGLADALERPALTGTEEQRARVARAIAHESERLARFVEDLRELAQLDDPAMTVHAEPFDLAVLARDVVDGLNAKPGATPVTLEASAARVNADLSRIEQIFVNLVTNARRYAPLGAPIRVHVSTAGDRARIEVEDGGPGVAEADLGKLGERMRRLDASRTRKTGGTGLGLSIVRAIADKHGGTVRFSRSELGGLAVEVALPTLQE